MAITASPGEPLKSYITLLNPDGSGITGETWTTVETEDPNGNDFVVTVSEIGGGHYLMEADTDTSSTPGEWFARVVGVNTGRTFVETWDVVPITYLGTTQGPTLSEIRAMLARQNGDYRKAEASESTDGTYLIDPFNLVENTDFFRGAEVICTSGNPLNVGARRKVSTSRYETARVDFLSAWPSSILVGDTFEFFNFSIKIPRRISEYDSAINDAIRAAWPQNRVKMYMEPTAAFDKDANGYNIPAEFTHVYDIKFKIDDIWYDVPPSRYLGEVGWYVDGARRTITLGGGYDFYADNRQVRIYGYGRPPLLTEDTDRTSTDVEWILDTASGQLLTSQLDQATFPIGQSRVNRADQLRAKMVRTPEPNTVALS